MDERTTDHDISFWPMASGAKNVTFLHCYEWVNYTVLANQKLCYI